MFFVVTFPAKSFQVILTIAEHIILNVILIKMYLMMNNNCRLTASLTEKLLLLQIRFPYLYPGLPLVEAWAYASLHNLY